MLAYILGITKWSYKGIGKRGKLSGLQIGAREITNRSSFRDFKLGQRDSTSGQGLQIGVTEITNPAEISNRGWYYKLVQNNLNIVKF